MNLTRVSTWEVGDADSSLLQEIVEEHAWHGDICANKCHHSYGDVLPHFSTVFCHKGAAYIMAHRVLSSGRHVVRWRQLFHRCGRKGKLYSSAVAPVRKIQVGVRPSGERGTEASHCVCLILKHISRSGHVCELLPAQLSSQPAGFA